MQDRLTNEVDNMEKNITNNTINSELKTVKERLDGALQEKDLDKIYHSELKSDTKNREYIKVVDDIGIGVTLDYNRVDGLCLIPAIEVRDEGGQWSSLAFNMYAKEQVELIRICLNLISDVNEISE